MRWQDVQRAGGGAAGRPAPEQDRSEITVTFRERGPLGLTFSTAPGAPSSVAAGWKRSPNVAGLGLGEVTPRIKAAQAGGAAARLAPQLVVGLLLKSVQRQPIGGRSFEAILQMIHAASRPLRLVFVSPDAVRPSLELHDPAEVGVSLMGAQSAHGLASTLVHARFKLTLWRRLAIGLRAEVAAALKSLLPNGVSVPDSVEWR